MVMHEGKLISREKIIVVILFFLLLPLILYLVGVKEPTHWVDYQVYYGYYFLSAKYTSTLDIISSMQDPLFVLLNKPFTEVNDGFFYFLLIVCFITITLKFSAFLKATNNYLIFFILYCCYFICIHDYIQIRISLSLAIMVFAIYRVNFKWLKYPLLIVAMLVHLSSSVVLIAYLYSLITKNKPRYFLGFLCVLTFLVVLMKLGLIGGERVQNYAEMASQKIKYESLNIFGALPALQLMGLFYLLYKEKYKAINFEYYISLLGVFVFYSMNSIPVVASRTFDISLLFYIIIVSKHFKKYLFIKGVFVLLVLFELKQLFYSEASFLHFATESFLSYF